MKQYLLRFLVSASCLFNVMLGGKVNETLPARCYREAVRNNRRGWFYLYTLINLLWFTEEDHCMVAYYACLQRSEDLLSRAEKTPPE